MLPLSSKFYMKRHRRFPDTAARTALHRSAAGLLAALMVVGSAAAQQPLALRNTQSLAFGRFVANVGGTVSISPTGARGSAGSVLLWPSSLFSEARFEVTGEPGFSFDIGLPTSAALTGSGGQSMTLRDFVSAPASFGTLDPFGRASVSVGAQLYINAQQPAGEYQGSFSISVNYY